jgi:indolepyruvate ferredoxin oxidoreductase beta subunit
MGCAARSWFLPCRELGLRAGSAQCANTVLLGAFCAAKLSSITPEDLQRTIRNFLPGKLVDVNLKAVDLGAEFILKK